MRRDIPPRMIATGAAIWLSAVTVGILSGTLGLASLPQAILASFVFGCVLAIISRRQP